MLTSTKEVSNLSLDDYIGIDISIKDLVEYDPNIGTESCHIFGVMGSGKSNFGYGVILTALLDRNEFAIMPGDVACEWKHFPMHRDYNQGLTIVIPKKKDVELSYSPKELKRIKNTREWFVEINYEELEVFDYLNKEKPLLIIYDQHLKIAERAELWSLILEQVVRREKYVTRAINFLIHEAGVIFPESARARHWNAVKDFSEIFVETRKMGVRIFFISQLETELEYTIRRKCNYKIIKKSFLRTEYAKPIRKRAPFLKVNEYILVYGGLYRLDNTFAETDEHKSIWKIVPPRTLKKNMKSKNNSRRADSLRGDYPTATDKNTDNFVSFRRGEHIILQQTDSNGRFIGKQHKVKVKQT